MQKRLQGIQGMTFGAMDAIINVVGIVVGLGVLGSRTATVVGLLVAGLANSFGNAAGFHVSEETEGLHSRKEVWLSTLLSFLGTISVTIILLLPLLLVPYPGSVIVSLIISFVLLVFLGLTNGKQQGLDAGGTVKLIVEYTALAGIVIIMAFCLGELAGTFLGLR